MNLSIEDWEFGLGVKDVGYFGGMDRIERLGRWYRFSLIWEFGVFSGGHKGVGGKGRISHRPP